MNRALELDAKNVFALSRCGASCTCGRTATTAPWPTFNAALKLQPGYSTALSNRGHVYVTMGDYERAKQDLDKAITVNPSARFPTPPAGACTG